MFGGSEQKMEKFFGCQRKAIAGVTASKRYSEVCNTASKGE